MRESNGDYRSDGDVSKGSMESECNGDYGSEGNVLTASMESE